MRKLVLCAAAFIFVGNFYAQQLAFPGAEGYGKYTVGGRGGAVYEVTNLNNTGEGSLRAAVEASGPRTVVFKVSGTIALSSNLNISNPNITIAGQTAPGDGICLRNYPLTISANQVIIRYIRVRLGDDLSVEADAVSARGCNNVILDHVSASWSVDETMSIYFCENTTIQWCMISESLFNSNHAKGSHGFGGIMGGNYSSIHHNLLAHHSSRNFRFASGCGNTDYRNNVVYNWGYNSAYGGENQQVGDAAHAFSNINMVANYYKPGPATSSGSMSYRIVNPSYRDVKTDYGKWYVSDNVVVGNTAVTVNNWNGGVQPSGGNLDSIYLKLSSPWPAMPISQQTATNAYSSVLDNAGASLPKRDIVDTRIVDNTRNGNASFEGAYNTVKSVPNKNVICGIIDSQSDVGGWPVLVTGVVPTDTDKDGMPDAWENTRSLNPSSSVDRNTVAADGYTMLEKYLNSIEFNNPVSGYKLTKQANGSILINWSDTYLDEIGFYVERSLNGTNFVTIAEELPKNSNSYTDNSIGSNKFAVYRVSAYNNEYNSPISSGITFNSTALNTIDISNSIKCYPTPFTDKLCFEIPGAGNQQVNIKIYDLVGHLVASTNNKIKILSDKIEWSDDDKLNSLTAGSYVGVLQIGDKRLGNIKLFKI